MHLSRAAHLPRGAISALATQAPAAFLLKSESVYCRTRNSRRPPCQWDPSYSNHPFRRHTNGSPQYASYRGYTLSKLHIGDRNSGIPWEINSQGGRAQFVLFQLRSPLKSRLRHAMPMTSTEKCVLSSTSAKLRIPQGNFAIRRLAIGLFPILLCSVFRRIDSPRNWHDVAVLDEVEQKERI